MTPSTQPVTVPSMSTTARQQAWEDGAERAAREGSEVAAVLFGLVAQPNAQERGGHSCRGHAVGFRTAEGRRGLRCGVCRTHVRWIDGEPA